MASPIKVRDARRLIRKAGGVIRSGGSHDKVTQGWVSSNTMQGQVHSAALIAGVFAETFHDEAVAKIPCFE
jgi:hypothetical protein